MPHQEYRRIIPGADTAVLFIHGILGTPDHFDFLLPHVPAEWSVVNLLLDGHGQGVREFSRTSMVRWQEQVRQEADQLLANHDRLVITAHSMGTLFALQTAIAYPDRVAALFLLAVPLQPAPRAQAFTSALRVGLSLGEESPLPAVVSSKKAYSIAPDRRVWRYVRWVPRYLELFRTIRQVEQQLPQLTVPTVAIQSDEDELVSVDACRPLGRCAAVTLHRLEHSSHHHYDPVDKGKVVTWFTNWVNGV